MNEICILIIYIAKKHYEAGVLHFYSNPYMNAKAKVAGISFYLTGNKAKPGVGAFFRFFNKSCMPKQIPNKGISRFTTS